MSLLSGFNSSQERNVHKQFASLSCENPNCVLTSPPESSDFREFTKRNCLPLMPQALQLLVYVHTIADSFSCGHEKVFGIV